MQLVVYLSLLVRYRTIDITAVVIIISPANSPSQEKKSSAFVATNVT